MFIPEQITDQRRQILQLLNVTCGREDITVSTEFASKDEGYLLMVRCLGGIDKKLEYPLWTGKSVKVEPTAETAIALSHLQVGSVNPFYTDSRFNDRILYNDNLTCTKLLLKRRRLIRNKCKSTGFNMSKNICFEYLLGLPH